MPPITLEEYAETHSVDINALHLLVAARHIPHKRLLGRIYVDDQVLENMKKEHKFWEKAWGSEKRRKNTIE